MKNIYDFEVETISGKKIILNEYKEKVLLVVNTASKCGLTPQYKELQELYDKYMDKGLEILGFPCNQFNKQEQGSNDEIKEFCKLNYGITFPMFAKIEVNGESAHPLFEYLKEKAPGVLGTKNVKWNFTKFLIDRKGNVIKRFAPTVTPLQIEDSILKLL